MPCSVLVTAPKVKAVPSELGVLSKLPLPSAMLILTLPEASASAKKVFIDDVFTPPRV